MGDERDGPNIIGNAEEMEAEQNEMNSAPNRGSPRARVQAQGAGLSSAVHAARQRQANAKRNVSEFSAAGAQRAFERMDIGFE